MITFLAIGVLLAGLGLCCLWLASDVDDRLDSGTMEPPGHHPPDGEARS
jgi:hypothetical protein